MFIVIFSFLCLCSEFCLGGDPYYAAEWSDVIRSCPNYNNVHFSCDDLGLGSPPNPDDEDGGLTLSGMLTFLENLEDGCTMDLQVSKCTEIGDEPIYNAQGDFCSSMQNPDTPWYPLVAALNTSSCPIPKAQYPLDGLKISLDFAKDVLNHEFCGEYTARLAIIENMDMISCHVVSLAVVEKYCDEE